MKISASQPWKENPAPSYDSVMVAGCVVMMPVPAPLDAYPPFSIDPFFGNREVW